MSLVRDNGIIKHIMQDKNHRKYILPAVILFIAAILRLYILLISNNCYKADPISRIMTTINWLRNISFIPEAGDWLPLHFYIMGLGLKIFNDPFFTPRFISFLFGIATLVVFYKLVHITFGEGIAFLSLCLLAFYPIHIVCSTVSLSEIIFLFFLLSFIYFCFKYILTCNLNSLFLSAVFLVLAAMTRYEAWVFIFATALLLYFRKEKRWSHIIFFLTITLIFPVFWVAHLKSNILLDKYNDISSLWFLNKCNISRRFFHWPAELYKSFGPIAFLSVLVGIFFSLREIKLIKYYSILFLGILLFFIFGTVARYISIDNTYSISFGVLMIPLSIYGMSRIAGYIRFKSIAVFLFMILTVGILMQGIIVPVCKSDVNLVADYLKYHTGSDDKVLIDRYNFGAESYYLVLFSRFSYGGNTMLVHNESAEEILEYINNEKPDYIVCSKKGAITDDIIDLLLPRLAKIITTDLYTVYRLT